MIIHMPDDVGNGDDDDHADISVDYVDDASYILSTVCRKTMGDSTQEIFVFR